jgi:lipopolysaccharide export system protein LptA
MKFALSIAMVAAFAILAAAQVTAPPVQVIARHGVLDNDNDVVRLRNVIVKVNGVEIRADDMEGTKAGREFTLRGNVRVMLPAPLTPSSQLRTRVGNDVVRLRGDVLVKMNGVEIRADDMEGTKAGREFTLRGNVRVMLPAPLTRRHERRVRTAAALTKPGITPSQCRALAKDSREAL